jgi:AcrR family transcriptional regulator
MSKRRPRRRAPGPSPVSLLEQRALPIVSELARVARDSDPPRVRLEGALEILLGAYGESDPEFSGLFLGGWLRARDDKDFRLTLAWQREQIRLCLHDILAEGISRGDFRPDLDPGAVSAVIVSVADGCLLQSVTQGGPVTAAELLRALLGLVLSGA